MEMSSTFDINSDINQSNYGEHIEMCYNEQTDKALKELKQKVCRSSAFTELEVVEHEPQLTTSDTSSSNSRDVDKGNVDHLHTFESETHSEDNKKHLVGEMQQQHSAPNISSVSDLYDDSPPEPIQRSATISFPCSKVKSDVECIQQAQQCASTFTTPSLVKTGEHSCSVKFCSSAPSGLGSCTSNSSSLHLLASSLSLDENSLHNLEPENFRDFIGRSVNNLIVKSKDKKRRRLVTVDELRKQQKKPNPWGEESYSDLIERAILSRSDKRMKLNEIYDYFIANIPYFAERSSAKDSSGWKNSIRHNLSLHSRFVRVQNEGAGKSSWWVINPDAKPGRNPRRQRSATLETSSKAALDKKRRGARKKVMEMRAGGVAMHSASSSAVGSQASILSRELYGDSDEQLGSFEPTFRPRTQSNLSMTNNSSRVSPTDFTNFDFPPFVEASVPRDILDRTNEISINHGESPAFHRPMANPMLSDTNAPSPSSIPMSGKSKQLPIRNVKEENGVQPPPSYHELNAVRAVSQLQNPLLRTHLMQNRIPSPTELGYNGLYQSPDGSGSGTLSTTNWTQLSGSSSLDANAAHLPLDSCLMRQGSNSYMMGNSNAGSATTALPMDLENLTLPEQPLIELDSMEALLRHELSQSTGNQLSFDNI